MKIACHTKLLSYKYINMHLTNPQLKLQSNGNKIELFKQYVVCK